MPELLTSFNSDYPRDNNIILIALMKYEDISSVVMNVKLVLFFAEVNDRNELYLMVNFMKQE